MGISVSNVRAAGSRIASTCGKSTGLLPMLRNFDATARYVDQGGGKRKGAFAIYLEPWHMDVRTVLDMKKNHGAEGCARADLFRAVVPLPLHAPRRGRRVDALLPRLPRPRRPARRRL